MDASSENELRRSAEPAYYGAAPATSSGHEFDLRSLLATLSRQWKTIAVTMAVVLVAALGLILLYDEKYVATSLLEVDDQNERLVRLNEQLFDGGAFNSRVDTEVQIIASPSVALKVIEKLQLWQSAEFGLRPSLLDRLGAWAGIETPGRSVPPRDFDDVSEDEQDELVAKLAKRIDASRRGLTGIIEVEAGSKSPELAAGIANALVDSYLSLQIERQVSAARKAAGFLEERVVELGRTIQEIEDRISQLAADNPADAATGDSSSEFQQLRREIADIGELRKRDTDVLKRLENFQVSFDAAGLTGLPIDDPLASMLAELRRLSSVEPRDELQVSSLENKLRVAVSDRIAGLRQELTKLDERAATLRDALGNILSHPSTMTEAGVTLFRLQRESETNRKLYDSYVARLGEVQQRIALTLPNSRVVARAMVPHKPSFPQHSALAAIALAVAALLSLAAAFVREHLIGGFTSTEQLESLSGVTMLSSVPTHPDVPHDAPVRQPLSAYSEAIRRMRIGIENETQSGKPAVVLLTSTVSGEGKSTIAISIARTFALAGKRTLLIDADLRNPSVHRLLAREPGMGIVETIGSSDLPKALSAAIGKDPESDLDVLYGTSSGFAGSDLVLGSSAFAKIFHHAIRKYQAIVIDSPPVGVVVDPLVVLPLVDLVLYVVKFAATNQRSALAGIREITGSKNAKPLLTVLNLSQARAGGYYYRPIGEKS
jgi:uncharacterized protein involved in exopolysaccharide biosynthesis/Mrp family chromosome partitioning ATPase